MPLSVRLLFLRCRLLGSVGARKEILDAELADLLADEFDGVPTKKLSVGARVHAHTSAGNTLQQRWPCWVYLAGGACGLFFTAALLHATPKSTPMIVDFNVDISEYDQMGCAVVCEEHGRAATCQDRMQWCVENVFFAEVRSACAQAHARVQSECPTCANCSLTLLRCTVAVPAGNDGEQSESPSAGSIGTASVSRTTLAPTRTDMPRASAVRVTSEPLSGCQLFGCGKFRTPNACQCFNCVEAGDCCSDYQGTCQTGAWNASQDAGVASFDDSCANQSSFKPINFQMSELPRCTVGPPLPVKVLTYNLFWWNLFNLRGGEDAYAARTITKGGEAVPFDFMGFQECEDPWFALNTTDLLREYMVVKGDKGTCMCYRNSSWSMISHGQKWVAEDDKADKKQYFGPRLAQWMRVIHKQTGRMVMFVNHHGPLPIDSGGLCGGTATARNLLNVIVDNALAGDAVVLVGDFNAGPASKTIQELQKHLQLVYHGDAFGGIDNVFTNRVGAARASAENLGNGGSDHDALSVTIEICQASSREPVLHTNVGIFDHVAEMIERETDE